MKSLYNFGVSQDDAMSEYRALDIQTDDHLLCIASAGEVPLNLAALKDIDIDAVDISPTQLYLSRLKWRAALHLEPIEAAQLIGYMPISTEKRRHLYRHLEVHLDDQERAFWRENAHVFQLGPIHYARFEQYIKKFSGIGLMILGKKKLLRLVEIDDVSTRQEYFDRFLASRLLKKIFTLAFHPKIYRKRGMAEEGLVHSGERNIADFFFSRFRDFCTMNPPRKNPHFQLSFFNRVLFPEALPEFLSSDGVLQVRKNADRLHFHRAAYTDFLQEKSVGRYNKFALSNLSDWMTTVEFIALYNTIAEKAAPASKALVRYIHYAPPIPENLAQKIQINRAAGEQLASLDRYPFYILIALTIV
ncbi:MAG: DUF3419 family protein [Calditrichaeota bacterium]|nr:MAG: DUF3419 family protein [Calditrichota bacterium]